jgi:DNA invertase Pin-like site-specific DNA recombinase
LGKSKLDGREDEIRRFLALDVSKASIAKITGVDRSTLYNFIRSRGIVLNS